MSYLVHRITEAGVWPDPQKVAAIERFPTATNPRQLKAFCGMISYYRRFIPNYSRIASLLYKLLKKDTKFEWAVAQENAFQHLKSKLTKQPILQYPDFSKKFYFDNRHQQSGIGRRVIAGTDWQGLAGTLCEPQLNNAESHYTTSEKELLAKVWATKYFRPYLYRRKLKTVSDYKLLVWIMNVKDPGSRLMRWWIQLAEYDYEIVHKSGVQNTNAPV